MDVKLELGIFHFAFEREELNIDQPKVWTNEENQLFKKLIKMIPDAIRLVLRSRCSICN